MHWSKPIHENVRTVSMHVYLRCLYLSYYFVFSFWDLKYGIAYPVIFFFRPWTLLSPWKKAVASKWKKLVKDLKDKDKAEESPSTNSKPAGMCPQSILEWSNGCNLFELLKGKMVRNSRYILTYHFQLRQ